MHDHGITQAAWIADADAFAAWAQRLAGARLIGLDTEFMRRNTFFPKLALLQLAGAGTVGLVDPLAFDAGAVLRGLLGGNDCICVMHSAGEDIEALAPLLPDGPARLFDTQIAAAMCGLGFGLSYQKLVAMLLDVAIPKDETRSDWLQRPLTEAQLAYAAQDVEHLETLHAQLSERLRRFGRDIWHAEDCARLRARAQRDEIDPQPQRAFRGASDWPRDAQARLRRVLRWRERSARTLDKPRPWLLEDAQALSMAQEPPATPDELFERSKGQRALRSAQRAELFEVLHAPVRDDELAELAPIPPAPSGEAKRALAVMRETVDTLAARLDLPAGLLCPRRAIEEYVVTRVWPDALAGWRRSVLEPVLSPLLA